MTTRTISDVAATPAPVADVVNPPLSSSVAASADKEPNSDNVVIDERTRARLAPWRPADRVSSWIWTGLVGLLALALRLTHLSFPPYKIFDEIYYSTDAWTLFHHGFEVDTKTNGPALVAHPPLGKWFIGVGEWLFGYNSFGWRFSAAIAGSIAVILLCRLGRRLFRSTLLGCVAGVLLSLDGLEFVMGRVALLDIFLMLLILAAFYCLVIDRDTRRAQIFTAMESGVSMERGLPHRTKKQFPIWRLLAAILIGLATGVKWTGVWYIALFIILFFIWEIQLRRSAGVKRPIWETISWETNWIFIFGVVAVASYLLTWTGWFATDGGYDRHWAEHNGGSVWYLPDALVSLWHYQVGVYQFHIGLNKSHPYQSSPYSWLILGRPVLFYYESGGTCGAKDCSSAILALGTPTLWWSFIPASIVALWRWVCRRDWRAGGIFLAAAAGIVPWMLYPHRTMFYFYALPSTPFLILMVTLGAGHGFGKINRPSRAPLDRNNRGNGVRGDHRHHFCLFLSNIHWQRYSPRRMVRPNVVRQLDLAQTLKEKQ